jgi:hypothetical protein
MRCTPPVRQVSHPGETPPMLVPSAFLAKCLTVRHPHPFPLSLWYRHAVRNNVALSGFKAS